jgi:apolipoprotein N-acyltransferase
MVLSSYCGAETVAALYSRGRKKYRNSQLPWLAWGCLAGGVLLVWLYGTLRLHHYRPSSSRSVQVTLIHAHVPSEQRWKRAYYARTFLKYVALTRQGIDNALPDLVVWPEFSLSFYLNQERALRAQLSRFIQQLHTSLLLGAPRLEESQTGKRYYNAAYFFSPAGQLVDVYSKIRLVPFTEYRPFTLPAVLDHTSAAPSEFTAGKRSTVFSLPHAAFGVMICFEATFPSLARRLVRGGSQFLVNISNETWLAGDAAAVSQHFAMAVLRAVENRRYLVRITTGGISSFVDPLGRPSQLSILEEGVVRGQVIPQQEMSLYTQYGDWFAWACLSFACLALLSTVRNLSSVRRRQS